MHVTINSQMFAHELRIVNKIAATKSTLPILGYLRLSVDPMSQSLQMEVTDIEIALRTTCPVIAVHQPGAATVSAARLLAMVEQFPDAEVTLIAQQDTVRITCGAFRSALQTLPLADFPIIPEIDGQPHTLNAGGFRSLIARTRYAVSEKAGQYFLQGSLLTLADPVAVMVATDGKRLALATIPQNGGAGARVLLPTKTLDILALQTDLGDMSLIVGTHHLFFVCGHRMVISRTLDATYPSYEKIIPRENTRHVVVDRFALAAALRRVRLLAEESSGVTFAVTPGSLDLSAATAQIGHADEQLAVQYDGEPLTMKVSGQAVLDMLNVATHPAITLAFKDRTTSLLVLDGDQHLAVILPMA